MVLQHRLQREGLRLPIDEREHVHAECRAQRGELQQLVEHLMWIRIFLNLNVDAHAVAVRLVAQVGNAIEALLFDEVRNLLNERRLVYLVRQLGDDDRRAIATRRLFKVRRAVNNNAAASVRVHLSHRINALRCAGEWILNGVVAIEDAAGREVWRVDVLTEIVDGELRVSDQGDGGVGDLAKVVRWNVCRHADGNTRGAVDEQVR